MEFVADQIRAGVFTPRLQHLPVAGVAGHLLAQLQEFDGNPMVLPMPADVPPEVPRIVLTNSADTMRLQVAVSRSDLVLRRQAASLDIDEFFERAPQVLETVLEVLGIRPGRLAATGTFFHRYDDPASLLANHFCRPDRIGDGGPLLDLQSFELHAHRRFDLGEGLVVNTWVRCKTGSVTEPSGSSRAIVVERDVNTIPEEADSRQFDGDALRNFMAAAGAHLIAEIDRFFPEELA